MGGTGYRGTAGSATGGVGPANTDRRVSDLADLAHSTNLKTQARTAFGYDPHRGFGSENQQHDVRRHLATGVVLCAIPYSNWYKVQLDGAGGSIGCCCGDNSGGFNPVGPKSSAVIPPMTSVILWQPPGLPYGVIIASIPVPRHESRLACPDYVVQGSGAGIKREAAYQAPFKQAYREGGVQDFSANRPLDQTALEWGKFTEHGLGIHIDPFLAFMRATEMSGVWFNFFDQHTRLAGLNFDLETAAWSMSTRDDEGEHLKIESDYVYPWEGLGQYAPGTPAGATYDAGDVQNTLHKAALDLAEGEEDRQPFSRRTGYGGYLGQGGQRFVALPPAQTGTRLASDDATVSPDLGVFEESVGLDGTYMVRSAKALYLLKTTIFSQPKQKLAPEDQSDGADDARQKTYKASGKFGSGAEHRVGDVDAGSDNPQLVRQAAIEDLIAYVTNWKSRHTFHYHQGDWQVPEESQVAHAAGMSAAPIDFSELAGKTYLSDPRAVGVMVDHRYGSSDYYARNSGLVLLPDGGVKLFSGCGCEIVMSGGRIRMSAPGGIDVTPGTGFNVLAGDDIVLRAKKSVDVSAGSGDLRLKGEKNVQMLSNAGGVLIESKASGFIADFENKVGEDVVSGGVVLKSKNGQIVGLAGGVYFSTGGDSLGNGDIVMDASKGSRRVILKGERVVSVASSDVSMVIGPRGDNTTVRAAHYFGTTVALGGGMEVDGFAYFNGDIVSNGFMANRGGYGYLQGGTGKIKADDLNKSVADAQKSLQSVKKSLSDEHKQTFPGHYYKDGQPGNDKTISMIGFSYRDDDDGQQMNVANFVMTESRWQLLRRLGGSGSGPVWEEPKVEYQGRQQLPYPGRKNWEDANVFLRLRELKLFDAVTGLPKDRGGDDSPYVEGKTGQLDRVTPKAGFSVIL